MFLPLVCLGCKRATPQRPGAGNFFTSASRWVKVSPDTAGLRPSITGLAVPDTVEGLPSSFPQLNLHWQILSLPANFGHEL
jgi:hypothetical protein